MKSTLRFFNEQGDVECVEVDHADGDERQDIIEALWDQEDRESRFDAVEW